MKELILHFENNEIRNKFTGQLFDGWGENLIKANKIDYNTYEITWFEGIDYKTAEEIIQEIESTKRK